MSSFKKYIMQGTVGKATQGDKRTIQTPVFSRKE